MASGIMHKAMVYLGLSDDYEDYAPAYDDQATRRAPEAVEQAQVSVVRQVRPTVAPVEPVEQPSGVVRPAVVRPISAERSARVHVVAPGGFGDAQEVGDRFKNSQPVVVDLKAVEPKLSRRMIDFCSGVTYALGGSMDRIADSVFLLTPLNVEVSADEKRRLAERGLYRV